MAVKKVVLAGRICDHLANIVGRGRDHKLFDVVKTGLQKMSIEEMDALLLVVSTDEMKTGIDRIKAITTKRAAPMNLMPSDIEVAKVAQDVTNQLSMLPTVAERLSDAWQTGNFPMMKRHMRITERITDNCRKMIAQQLYDAIKIEIEEADE
jgi:hypothetical protein